MTHADRAVSIVSLVLLIVFAAATAVHLTGSLLVGVLVGPVLLALVLILVHAVVARRWPGEVDVSEAAAAPASAPSARQSS